MTYTLPSDVARCDGAIHADPKDEPCQRRETCQRYIAHRSDFDGGRVVAWMAAVHNCNVYIQWKP